MRILVVNEDKYLINLLSQALTKQFHVIDMVKDIGTSWHYLQSKKYELILLNFFMPQQKYINFCTKARSLGYVIPIILITAKDTIHAGIQGLDAGADDYITKPINLNELNARIRAISRRQNFVSNTTININELVLNTINCQVSYQEKPLKLTPKEYSLLELFVRNPKRVYSRSQILDLVWTLDSSPSEDCVKTHIQGIRKKLQKVGAIDWIKNIYGVGYILDPNQVSKIQDIDTKQLVHECMSVL